MKKILIVSHAMELGGVEKALLGILEAIDTSRVEVDLFLMRHAGELMEYLPKKINLLPEIPEYASLAVPIKEVLKKGQIKVAYGRYRGKKKAKARVKALGLDTDNDVGIQCSHLFTLPLMPMISDKRYDAAISFLTPHYFVKERVKADKKIAWIHTDYRSVAVDIKTQYEMWSAFDQIVSISEGVSEGFLTCFPGLKGKLIEIKHIMPVNYIDSMATQFSVNEEMLRDGSIRLLSIGRFCKAKNFDNVPNICRLIRNTGLNVKWYLIGYGGDEALIRTKIQEMGMESNVIMLGKKANPYPYIKECDVYVQPSRYEGMCISVIEAQLLNKPVIITNYATAESQIKNGINGFVVQLDNKSCAEQIAKLIQDKDKLDTVCNNCMCLELSGQSEIDKLYRMVGV